MVALTRPIAHHHPHAGIAFPTSLSVNNCVSHFSPLVSDVGVPKLAAGDVVKLQIGVHIDGVGSWSSSALKLPLMEGGP